MQLSLAEAARILGKSRRQVLYLIEQGRLPAKKVGGRWEIDRADLQVDEQVQQRSEQQKASLQAAVEDAMSGRKDKRSYTLRDLRAVKVAVPLYQQLVSGGAERAAAAQHLRVCLDQLGMGCHRFHRAHKASAYNDARDAASLACVELLLGGSAGPLMDTIEQELMPALGGLVRRNERKSKRYDE